MGCPPSMFIDSFPPNSGGGGGVTVFTGLTDTPANYVGAALQNVRVNVAANALEFFTPATIHWRN